MVAVVGALLAGVLTTLAPCVLPLLPVIVGGSLTGGRRRAVLVTVALGASVTVFTLALKATTALIGVPPLLWRSLSGALLVLLGLAGLFPTLWEHLAARLSLQARTTTALASSRRREGTLGALATGAALGPVFSSCSPLYGYVVITVLPARFGYGLVLLAAYVLGLCATLLAIALAGRRLVRRLGWAADAGSPLRRILGLVFIVVGVVVLAGWDRAAQTWILDHSPIAPWEWVG